MLQFLWGIIVGAFIVLAFLYVILFDPFGGTITHSVFVEQFQPIRLPEELRQFLKGNENGEGVESQVTNWESCFNLSLILHFLFQEHKDTRRLRRWFHKKLQLELSDLTTRNAAGRLIQDIRIRDLSIGSKSPVIKAVRVESYEMSQDEDFKTLNLLVDVDYTGGFQSSVDVTMLFGRFAQLSIKLTRLSGKLRLKLTREPFTHWAFAFADTPVLEFQVDSQWQGKQVKHLIPFITQQFRRIVQRKHVWPNYKIRYRPFFPNPLYQPSPPIGAYEYVKVAGVLEVTVLRCTRLNVALVSDENSMIFCVLSIDERPLMQNASRSSTRCVTVLLNFSRHGITESIGMTFSKLTSDAGVRSVQVSTVESSSSAERCGFKPGDVVLAVNNVPITSERQLSKLLSGTSGELSVLVDRTIYEEAKASLSALSSKGDDTASMSDFEEVIVPEIFEKADDENVLMKLPKKGIHRRSRSSTAVRSEIKSYDVMASSFKEAKMSRVHTYGKFSSSLSRIPFGNLDSEEIALIQPDYGAISEEHVGIRRVRSEIEIRRNRNQDNEKLKPSSTSSFENSLNIAHTEIGKTLSNVAEDIVVASAADNVNDSSIGSLNTDVSIENSSKECIRSPSRRERFQARAAEMAAAGKAKMSDFWYRHRDSAGPGAEVAVDALSQHDVGPTNHLTCCANSTKVRPLSPMSRLERKKKSPLIRREKPAASLNDGSNDNLEMSKMSPKTLATKPLAMSEDILWGQSLHFDLNDTSKYLNVTVRAKRLDGKEIDVTATQDSQTAEKDASQILGYASIYVPQLLDDCQLTLSSYHRELFTLRPPFWSAARRPLTTKASEESRRAGFDERLCYGDIVLGFRYFPAGLPMDVQQSSSVENADTVKNGSDSSLEAAPEIKHHFETIMLKGSSICAVCRGKVWLKMASHCTGCLLVCHNKCVPKVTTVCSQRPPIDDSAYEVLDEFYMDSNEGPKFLDDIARSGQMMAELSSAASAEPEERPLTRRRRIAVRVSERISSTFKSVGRRRASFHPLKESQKEPTEQTAPVARIGTDEVVPVGKTIPDVFALLELPEELNQMMYQPGNAYNEQMINAAKKTGKDLFADLDPVTRKAKINEDMEKIRSIIHQTTVERLDVMENMKEEAQSCGSAEFALLDDRLQALAVLMLHYCAALQNCIDLEESCGYQKENVADAVQDSCGTNVSVAEEAQSADGECTGDVVVKAKDYLSGSL